MALPTWPAELPYRPLREGYALLRRYAPAVTTPMEDGPDRQRASSTSVWAQIAYRMEFTQAQFDVADDFVVRTLVRGTARFMMPVGRPGTPDPWAQRLVYLEGGLWKIERVTVERVIVSFTLNVLDW